jgi:hypothetical protein
MEWDESLMIIEDEPMEDHSSILPASFVANDLFSMRSLLIIYYPFNSSLYFLLVVFLEYEISNSHKAWFTREYNQLHQFYTRFLRL